MKTEIKSFLWIRKLYRTRWFWTIKNWIKELIQKSPHNISILDDRDQLDDADQVLLTWPAEHVKPSIGLVRDRNNPPYWTKYERFLRNNQFPYEYFDIHRSDWLEAAKPFDVIIWGFEGVAPEIDEHKRKIYTLEHICGKNCFPSFETSMWYEDKIYQYEWLKLNNFPIVETFVSHSYSETIERIKQSTYPMVSKVHVGAASLGVELVNSARQAQAIARQVFSPLGRKTYWPYFRQKGYVYLQNFLPNQGYDLRVIAVGNRAFGYYRDVPKAEFRASGMGLVRKAALPEDAVKLAMRLIRELNLVIASVDMLRDLDGKLYIIEVQPNITVETPEQLHVDGIPGAYVFDSSGSYKFEPCKLWIQELALHEYFKRWGAGR
jgi:glutathione synthase/RimK-type ligase-like ATP-grasp enzyme